MLDNVLHEANMMDRKKGQTRAIDGQKRKWIQGVRRERKPDQDKEEGRRKIINQIFGFLRENFD